MKKIYLAIMACILISKVPPAGTDIANLMPVEVVQVCKNRGQILVSTDTAASGYGKSLQDALIDMHDKSAGTVFLETADYLLMASDCIDQLDNMAEYVRPAVKICVTENEIELSNAAQYLKTHEPETTLAEWRGGIRQISKLKSKGGELSLVTK